MKYVLDTPITVGDLSNPILIDQLELASVSFNFEPYYSDKGCAALSIVLVHRASDHKFNIVFNDADSLTNWKNIDGPANAITRAIFNRLSQAGKLPAGSIQK